MSFLKIAISYRKANHFAKAAQLLIEVSTTLCIIIYIYLLLYDNNIILSCLSSKTFKLMNRSKSLDCVVMFSY